MISASFWSVSEDLSRERRTIDLILDIILSYIQIKVHEVEIDEIDRVVVKTRFRSDVDCLLNNFPLFFFSAPTNITPSEAQSEGFFIVVDSGVRDLKVMLWYFPT